MADLLATSVANMEIFSERTNVTGSSSHMACLLATSGDYGQNILVVIEIICFQEHRYKLKNIQGYINDIFKLKNIQGSVRALIVGSFTNMLDGIIPDI